MRRILVTLKAACFFILALIPITLNKIWLEPYINRYIGFATFTGKALYIQKTLEILHDTMPVLWVAWLVIICLLFWYDEIMSVIKGEYR